MSGDWRADLRWGAALVVLNVVSGIPYDFLYITVLHRASHPTLYYGFPWLTVSTLPLAMVVTGVVVLTRRAATHSWRNWSRVLVAVLVVWTLALHSWAILWIVGVRLV